MNIKIKNTYLSLLAVLMLANPQPLIAQEEDSEATVDNIFVQFAPISVSIIREYRIRGQLAVTFYLSVDKASNVEKIETMRPKLRDNLIYSLTRIANTRVSPNKPVDLDLLGRFLQKNVDDVLGEGVAKVLIQSAAAQPY